MAQALAGNLTDELEALVDRSRPSLQEKKVRHLVRVRDCAAGPDGVQRTRRSS